MSGMKKPTKTTTTTSTQPETKPMTEVTKPKRTVTRAPQGPKEALAVYRVVDADGNPVTGVKVTFDYLGFDGKSALDALDKAAGAASYTKKEIPAQRRAAPKA